MSSERQRLVETHASRVIALINDQRRAALEGFLAALQGDPPQVQAHGDREQKVRRTRAGLGSLCPSHRQSASFWPYGATCVRSRRSRGTRCGTTSTWLQWILRRPSRCASRCSYSSSPQMPCHPQTAGSSPVPQTLFLSHGSPLVCLPSVPQDPLQSLNSTSCPLDPYFLTLEHCPHCGHTHCAFDPLLLPWILTSWPLNFYFLS